MRRYIITLSALAFLASLTHAGPDLNLLRQECISLAKECRPAIGTPIKEVKTFWKIDVGHNASFDEDIVAVEITPYGHPGVTRLVQLYFKHEKGVITESKIILTKINTPKVSISDNEVQFPEPWTEETYLKVSLLWLKLLKKKLDTHKKQT